MKAAAQVLEEKLVRRKVSLKALDYGKIEEASKGSCPSEGQAPGWGSATRRGTRDRQVPPWGASGIKGVQHQVQADAAPRDRQRSATICSRDQSLREHDFGVPLEFAELPRLTSCRSRAGHRQQDLAETTARVEASLRIDRAGASVGRCRYLMRSPGRPTSRPHVPRSVGSLDPGRAVENETIDAFLSSHGKTGCVYARVDTDDDLTEQMLTAGSTSGRPPRRWSATTRWTPTQTRSGCEVCGSPNLSRHHGVRARRRRGLRAPALPEAATLGAVDRPGVPRRRPSIVALAARSTAFQLPARRRCYSPTESRLHRVGLVPAARGRAGRVSATP